MSAAMEYAYSHRSGTKVRKKVETVEEVKRVEEVKESRLLFNLSTLQPFLTFPIELNHKTRQIDMNLPCSPPASPRTSSTINYK